MGNTVLWVENSFIVLDPWSELNYVYNFHLEPSIYLNSIEGVAVVMVIW